MRVPPPSCSIRCSKNNCARRAWNWNFISTRAQRALPNRLPTFRSPANSTPGPEGYLNHICKAKAAVNIPIIASLNGATLGGWTQYAKQIEQAGADAIECNIYFIPTDMEHDSAPRSRRSTSTFSGR